MKVVTLSVALVAVPLAFSPCASAQATFTVAVRDASTRAPVISKIEYEASPGVWRTIKQTDAQGVLRGTCPGAVSIRANASPAFRLSPDELCGGDHALMVTRRTVREIIAYLPDDSPLTSSEWVIGYTAAALAEGRAKDAAVSDEQEVLLQYVSSPGKLPALVVRDVNLNLRAGPIQEFREIDANNDAVVSQAELQTALRGN